MAPCSTRPGCSPRRVARLTVTLAADGIWCSRSTPTSIPTAEVPGQRDGGVAQHPLGTVDEVMTTWGPSKKKTARRPIERHAAGRPRRRLLPRRWQRAGQRVGGLPVAGQPSPATPHRRRHADRQATTDELRQAVAGASTIDRHRLIVGGLSSRWPRTSISPARSVAASSCCSDGSSASGGSRAGRALIAAGVALVRHGPVVEPVAPADRLGPGVATLGACCTSSGPDGSPTSTPSTTPAD